MKRTVHALQQVARRLLRRPAPGLPYPRVVEGTLSSGRPYRFVIDTDPQTWTDDEPVVFTAPVTLEDVDAEPTAETARPRLIPGMAVSLAAARQHLLEVAGLADDDDPDQERDRRLVWWFRRERARTDEPR